MDPITIELTREEAIATRFLLAGAGYMPNITPPQRLAAQEALGKVDAALAPPAPADPAPGPAPELGE